MPKLTPDIVESLYYGEMLPSQVLPKIQAETHNNQFAFPLLGIL
jgi:ABC-type enterochelin transport system permease subunit